MQRVAALERLKRNEGRLRAAGISALYMFGSTNRNEARADSDVDLFFDPAGRMSLFDVMQVRDELESVLAARADVTTRQSLHPYLRERIEAEAQRIF